MLDEDRNQRAEQQRRFKQSMGIMRTIVDASRRTLRVIEGRDEEWRATLDARATRVEQFLESEATRVQAAVAREHKYVDDIKVHMARRIVKLLATIRQQIEAKYAVETMPFAWTVNRLCSLIFLCNED